MAFVAHVRVPRVLDEVSALKGDGKAKSLVNAWLDSPIMKGVFKDKVDENVARSIFERLFMWQIAKINSAVKLPAGQSSGLARVPTRQQVDVI